MAKLFIVGLALVAILQLTLATDLKEALNNNIRAQLRSYEKFLAEDDGTHKDDLKSLISLYETALKSEDYDEKSNIVITSAEKYTPEFNKYVALKVEENQVNDDIAEAIRFYSALLPQAGEQKAEVEKTIETLKKLQTETELRKREEGFLDLDKSFSPEFVQFLKNNALPKVNRDLQNVVDFFDNILADEDIKQVTEIKALQAQAKAALVDGVSIDDKQKTLYEVTNPKDRELYEFLQKKFIEQN